MELTAVLSMLHEPAAAPSAGARPADSASRLFRGQPVLAWTLARLSRAKCICSAIIICWEDQFNAVKSIARETGAQILVRSARARIGALDAVSAALRWADGWRGGLLGACHFDRGFFGPAVADALAQGGTPECILIDPSAGLIDPDLVQEMAAHADSNKEIELFFSQAAPGLCGTILRNELVQRLAAARTHPGRLLSYWPDTPGRDPITTASCLAAPSPIARTLHRFTLDSERQIRHLSAATSDLNGELISTDARGLVAVLDAHPQEDPLPREVALEISTRRATRPIYSPATHLNLARGDMRLDPLKQIIDQLGSADDFRLTLAGAGDPLLHPEFPEISRILSQSNIPALHIETDLVDVSEESLAALAAGRFDVITIHLPAATAPTYERVMGVAGLDRAMANLRKLIELRAGTTPIIVPTFTKCRQNLDEMEPWYDHFLRAMGAAAIVGPSDYSGQIPDHACADMAPKKRRPCARIHHRMTLLSDGTIPACEQDVMGKHPIGHAAHQPLTEIWQSNFKPLRADHQTLSLDARPLCTTCKEWHRP